VLWFCCETNKFVTHLEVHTPVAPLETHSGMSSPHTPQGYHTPVDDEFNPSLTPQRLSQLLTANNAPTPTSGAYTISLDGYMESGRMSIGSPPHSDSHRIILSDEEESFPVFSPPPYEEAVFRRKGHRRSLSSGNHPFSRRSFARRRRAIIPPPIPKVPPWQEERRHSACLSPSLSHHTCNVPCLPAPDRKPLYIHLTRCCLNFQQQYLRRTFCLFVLFISQFYYDLSAL